MLARICLLIVVILALSATAPADESGLTNFPIVDVRTDLVNLEIHETNALADGVERDSAPIQAAIDYVAELGGGTVLVPAGVYRVTEIDVKPDVHLTGEGQDKTIFRAAGTSVMFRPSGGRLSNFSAYGSALG